MIPAHCDVIGATDAPALVLLHPIATHRQIWAAQVAVLSRRYRVITLDLLGHGQAPAPEAGINVAGYARHVLETLDMLGIDRFAMVGLSMGGMVAQALALLCPQRISALVLAHTGCKTSPQVAHIWEERLHAFETQGMAAQVTPTLARWFTPGFLASAPATVAWVADMVRGTSAGGYVSAIRAIQQLDHLDRLGELHMPTLVIAGDKDGAIPAEVSQDMARRLPQGRLHMLPTAHVGNVEQPVAFTETVRGFLDEVVPLAIP